MVLTDARMLKDENTTAVVGTHRNNECTFVIVMLCEEGRDVCNVSSLSICLISCRRTRL